MTDIYSLTYEQAEKLLTENGFRATQCVNIFRDIYKRRASGFDEMTLTSADIKALLSDKYFFGKLKIDEILQSVDTSKYLFELSDGCRVETVLMRGWLRPCSISILRQVLHPMIFPLRGRIGDFLPIIGQRWQKTGMHGGKPVLPKWRNISMLIVSTIF